LSPPVPDTVGDIGTGTDKAEGANVGSYLLPEVMVIRF
jgi:hypothetical protein